MMKVADVVFREDLYPRIEKSATTVQQYAESLEVLPPIEVNQHGELIDGWHRWTAHRKMEALEIASIVTETTSDAHLLELAIERNASHGLQLSIADKQNMARQIYHATATKDRDGKKAHLAKILSVSERTVRGWLSRIDKDTKADRDRRILSLWLACYTQEEIGEEVGITHQAVDLVLQGMAELPKLAEPAASHTDGFEVPIYNVWKQQTKSEGSSHFGNSEVRWVDNLLYLYTKPLDIVVDPFAGGGSTIDICKKRWRRYWVSDRKPVVEREADIRKWDINDGVPPLPRWQDVGLVYLDPPYWKQAEGQYSTDAEDLANMPLDQFNGALAGLIAQFAKKLRSGARIALIIQPTQWKAPDRAYTDHVADMLRLVKLPVEMRISAPYESQQCNAQMVDWAKENRSLLVLSREIVVWRVK